MARALPRLGGVDHVLLLMDHDREDARVIDPYCVYLALGTVATSGLPTLDEDDDMWSAETAILRDLLREMRGAFPDGGRAVESGSPDVFRGMSQWAASGILRGGRLSSEVTWPETTLRGRLAGEGLVVTTRYESKCRPADTQRWEGVKDAALLVVEGNRNWRVALEFAFSASEKDPEGLVDLYVYDPEDILLSLQSAQRNDQSYIPFLRYTHRGAPDVQFEILGSVEWVKEPSAPQWDALLSPYGGSVTGYLEYRMLHETRAGLHRNLQMLGLSYGTFLDDADSSARLFFQAGGEPKVVPSVEPPRSLAALVEHRPDLGRWLDTTISPGVPFPVATA